MPIMIDDVGGEYDAFHSHLNWLPPEDKHFLMRLMIELSRRAGTDGALSMDETILQATREIAPERVRWVADRLGLGGVPDSGRVARRG